jgi:hypothetical protein
MAHVVIVHLSESVHPCFVFHAIVCFHFTRMLEKSPRVRTLPTG